MTKKIILLLFISFTLEGQDSLRHRKFQIFDLIIHGSVPILTEEKLPDLAFVSSFAKNQDLVTESKGYSYDKFRQTGYYGGDVGLLATFKLNAPKTKFQSRLKPRLGLYYSSRTIFEFHMGFSESTTIDTIKFTNPNVAPIIIDSSMSGRLDYIYVTSQALVEFGCNVDIVTLRYFNFYTGLICAQGFSFKNDFSVRKQEYYSIDKYPDQNADTEVTLKNYTLHESGNQSYLSAILIPIGMQHRFSIKRNFSPGIFIEIRPGYEIYRTQNGPSVSNFIFSLSGGLRISLCRHK